MRKVRKNLLIAGAGMVGIFAALNYTAKKSTEQKDIDDDNPYFNPASLTGKKDCESPAREAGSYESKVKPALDKVLSFGGLVMLSPLFAVISLVVFLDDPGPVFFTQKRIGKNKHYVMIHKFRTMAVSAPHDVPTHQLAEPERYITKVGRVLRKTSLDELPQIWDIFRGRMSVVGPRPALWNQEDLVAEREKWDANSVLPGLTGLAQIKGRDELEISDKAEIDGEYVRVLGSGGVKAFWQDIKIFTATIASVARRDGVVEGGTGTLSNSPEHRHTKVSRGFISPTVEEAGFEEYGYKKTFHIDKEAKRKVLITGAGSYIGESLAAYCREYYPNIDITIIDMVDGSWREKSFEGFDTVFHVAGIAHADAGHADRVTINKYYSVNTDLAIETAEKAKKSGVLQFIFMSSMIIYEGGRIDEHTVPKPSNFYGDSKWQADKGVRALQSPDFHIAVLRPPMIYGKGSKGNYPILAKIAKKLPIFPDIDNERSMLFIGNLCEFVVQLALSGESGVYFPQNPSYTKTSKMVTAIADEAWHPITVTKLLNPVVRIASHIPGKAAGLVNKAFGNRTYAFRLSTYAGLEYQIYDIYTSITLTEGKEESESEDYKTVLI